MSHIIFYLVLDLHINLKQLQIDYDDHKDLLYSLNMSVLDLCVHYHEHYRDYTSQHTPAEPRPTQVASSSRNRSALKVDFTARYSTKDVVDRDEIEEYFNVAWEKDWELCNPLEWWVGHCTQFPNLFKLARDILTIPGKFITSVWFLA